MKDEELAEEYLKEKLEERKDKFVFELPEVYITDVKEAFLAGLKAGRPQWHEPEETIEKNKIVLGHIKDWNKNRYSLVQWNGEWWYQYGTYNEEVRLIEWCEIPTFDKE